MDIPKQLYHYTTINNLALILNSRALNFGRLDFANDKREALSSDFGSFAQYIFISCWTETSEENLALWNMYTPKMRGVRIEMPLPIFEIYKINNKHDSIVRQEEILNREKNIFIVPHLETFYKVTYTDDESELSPPIKVKTNEFSGFDLKKIGTCKKTIWNIENEWRYRLNILPLDKNNKSENPLSNFADLIDAKIAPPINGYLVKIHDSAFRKMKIRLGPRMEPGDYEIIKSLVSQYNPTVILEESSLSNEIR